MASSRMETVPDQIWPEALNQRRSIGVVESAVDSETRGEFVRLSKKAEGTKA